MSGQLSFHLQRSALLFNNGVREIHRNLYYVLQLHKIIVHTNVKFKKQTWYHQIKLSCLTISGTLKNGKQENK